MGLESTKRINEGDINKLEKQYARGKVYIAGIIKKQESIINLCEKEVSNKLRTAEVARFDYPFFESGYAVAPHL